MISLIHMMVSEWRDRHAKDNNNACLPSGRSDKHLPLSTKTLPRHLVSSLNSFFTYPLTRGRTGSVDHVERTPRSLGLGRCTTDVWLLVSIDRPKRRMLSAHIGACYGEPPDNKETIKSLVIVRRTLLSIAQKSIMTKPTLRPLLVALKKKLCRTLNDVYI